MLQQDGVHDECAEGTAQQLGIVAVSGQVDGAEAVVQQLVASTADVHDKADECNSMQACKT